tara:strand:- start:3 stop:929 length:927 start_codon:yes stop_codon:yes gene_type:complete
MVAAAVWVAPIVALQIVVADAYAAYFLVLWKRRGELAFPPCSVFDRAATILCQPGNPNRKAQLALLVLRVMATVWQLVVLVYAYSSGILHANLTGKPSNLAKFTVWNYHLQTIFWLVSATVSIRHITQQRSRVGLSQQEASIPSDAEEQCSNPSPRCGDRFLEVTQPLLLAVCVPTSVLVSVVFWLVLVPGSVSAGVAMSDVLHFTSYNMHAVNTLTILAEFGLNRLFVPPQQLLFYLLWATLYVFFQWAVHPLTHEWAYPFLALDPVALAWYPGVLAVFMLLYWAALGLSKLKRNQIEAAEIRASAL